MSWWDDYKDAIVRGGEAVRDTVYPGETTAEKLWAIVDGRSPLSPIYPGRKMSGMIADNPDVCGPLSPACSTYGATSKAADQLGDLTAIVDRIPLGWLILCIIVAFIFVPRLWAGAAAVGRVGVRYGAPVVRRVAAHPTVQRTARDAGTAYIATRPSLSRWIPTPPQPGRHARGTGARMKLNAVLGRVEHVSGEAEIIAESERGAELCCDTPEHGVRELSGRRQGYRITQSGTAVECPSNPAKCHVDVTKRRELPRAARTQRNARGTRAARRNI